MALPCAKSCGRFQEGCHKTCSRWKIRQYVQHMQRERKKAYLRDSHLLCAEVERQWYRAFSTAHW